MTRRDRRLLWLRHSVLMVISVVMLAPFYWVLKASITGENIYDYPPHLWPVRPNLFNFVDVWYLIPFPRYLLNSIIVSLIAVAGNLVLNAIAGYALTLPFIGRRSVIVLLLSCTLIPFQATIIPAYLITAHLGLLNSYLGLALPLLSTIVCIFVFKASFDAVPRSLIDAARIDGLGELRILLRVMLPLSTPAVATNVVLSFIWSWNNFLWPLIITNSVTTRPLTVGLSVFATTDQGIDWSIVTAATLMTSAPLLVAFLLFQRQFVQSFMRAGIR